MCTGCRFWRRGHRVEVWPCELDVHKGVGKIGLGGEKMPEFCERLWPLKQWQRFLLNGGGLGQSPQRGPGTEPLVRGSEGHSLLNTHTCLMALFPGLPRWASTRKVKLIWILLKQETVSGSGISWTICKSAPRSRLITTPAPHHSVFYRPDALPAAKPTAS